MNLAELRQRNFISPKEAAAFFGTPDHPVDERTVRRAAEGGQIPSVKIGTKTLIPVPPLLALLDVNHAVAASEPSAATVDQAAVLVALQTIKAAVLALETLMREDAETEAAEVVSIKEEAA